jgi:hypothetical protein
MHSDGYCGYARSECAYMRSRRASKCNGVICTIWRMVSRVDKQQTRIVHDVFILDRLGF